jgi:hypothetical protein
MQDMAIDWIQIYVSCIINMRNEILMMSLLFIGFEIIRTWLAASGHDFGVAKMSKEEVKAINGA